MPQLYKVWWFSVTLILLTIALCPIDALVFQL